MIVRMITILVTCFFIFKIHAQSTKWSFSMTRFVFLAFVFLSSAELFFSQNLIASVISPVSAQVWPNPLTTGDDLPGRAIDGSIYSFTFSTAAYNTSNASLGLQLSGLTNVSRIRLWKDIDTGDPAVIYGRKDLIIQYTTDTNPLLSTRTWVNVTGLSNGYQGTENFIATSVNSDGTVVGDYHNSPNGDGWGSLTFNPVQATGIRILFSKTSGETYTYMHYRVYEFEVYGSELPSVPEPTSIAIFSALGSLGVVRGFKRYRKR